MMSTSVLMEGMGALLKRGTDDAGASGESVACDPTRIKTGGSQVQRRIDRPGWQRLHSVHTPRGYEPSATSNNPEVSRHA